ncbi:MAG: two-component system nitrate/nitrite sensor histidine kinase NarX [Paraglaciecola sp.]|jgi:two-component system nitrate/nitrite sensor histidine kinase NarX
MFKDIIHSTVFKIAGLMFAISFLAVASMLSSFMISDGAQLDARAINVAGSLRMQNFRMLSQLQQHALQASPELSTIISTEIQGFERDLTTGVLANQIVSGGSEALAIQHQKVLSDWFEVIKPGFVKSLDSVSVIPSLYIDVPAFVEQVNVLVMAYQQHAEANISLIRLIQTLSLFATLIVIASTMIIINKQVEKPLSNLLNTAKQISRGDFTAQADESGKGELALLAQAFNKMSQNIYRSQSQLEKRVSEKTLKLENSNKSIQLLYQLVKKLNEFSDKKQDYAPILKQLAEVTGVKDLDLCIMTASGQAPYEHLLSTDKTLPEKCVEHDCADCTEHDVLFPQSGRELKYPLTRGEKNFGVLVCNADGEQLEDWQHQLFMSVADQVATGLSMRDQHAQSRRIALMNERAVIARELHDSLAQALSYLKMQVSRMQKLRQIDGTRVQIDEVIDELKGGLSSAYRELRELLTTFRLKIDGQTLRASFEQTVEHLKVRSEAFEFALDFEVDNIPFTPQEEIHLLQIAREATQNAFYHSQGDSIEISLNLTDEGRVSLTVRDNGVGIQQDPNKINHYGLAIMQERSRSLGGEISVTQGSEGGTVVSFSFAPEYAKSSEADKLRA